MEKRKAEWKEKAERLFFIEHLSVRKICEDVGKTRKHVAAHLSSCDGYISERERRKAENARKRKADKRQWDRDNRHRSREAEEDRAMLMNDHRQAVAELSHEKYH